MKNELTLEWKKLYSRHRKHIKEATSFVALEARARMWSCVVRGKKISDYAPTGTPNEELLWEERILNVLNTLGKGVNDYYYYRAMEDDNKIGYLSLKHYMKYIMIVNESKKEYALLKYGKMIKVGKLFKKKFPSLTDGEIRTLTEKWVSIKSEIQLSNDFYGAYHYENYVDYVGTQSGTGYAPLHDSCMRECAEYCERFYSKYDCKIAVIKEDGLIRARAIVWNTNKGIYVDRIYVADYEAVVTFKAWIELNGYMWHGCHHEDVDKIVVKNIIRLERDDRIPYLDSMECICLDTHNLYTNNSNCKGDYFSQLSEPDCAHWDSVMCDYCEEYVNNDYMYVTHNQNDICDDCYKEHFFTCVSCGEIYPRCDGERVDGDCYCSDCFSDVGIYCSMCNEAVHNDDIAHVNSDNDYCLSCAERYFFPCEECGVYTRTEDIYRMDDGVEICGDCLEMGCYFKCEECKVVYTQGFKKIDDERFVTLVKICKECKGDCLEMAGETQLELINK